MNNDDNYDGLTLISHNNDDDLKLDEPNDLGSNEEKAKNEIELADQDDVLTFPDVATTTIEERLTKLEADFAAYKERVDKALSLLESKSNLTPSERILLIQEDS